MASPQVLANWKTVVSNSAQFRTLVGAALPADALPYVISFAADSVDFPANDDVVMYAAVEDGAKRRFGSTGAGVYTGTITAAIDIKQSKVAALQPTLETLEEYESYVSTLSGTIVSQIETYVIESGLLILDDIESTVFFDEESKPDRDIWVIQITSQFGPR